MSWLDEAAGYGLDMAKGGLSGGLSAGLATGFTNPYAIGGGAALGGAAGAYGHYKAQQGKNAQKDSFKEAQARLEALANAQRQQRAQDMQKALAFFGPAQQSLKDMYGSGFVGPKPWEAPGVGAPGMMTGSQMLTPTPPRMRRPVG